VILKEGQVCKYFYFIVSGCIRSFGLEMQGREREVLFEDDIACDFISFRKQEPSQFFFVAMEDCTVYCATKTEAEPIFRNTASLHLNLFRFFQELYLKEEEHSNNLKLLSPRGATSFFLNITHNICSAFH
jgi:CRP-like cAMP-binding protein